MTAAFNLSQLANNLNTSGQLDATDGLTGAVPVANGGTGAITIAANAVVLGNGTSAVQTVAPGTAGNVLTSNGTTWTSAGAPAPTTTQVLSATASASAGDVGTYAWCCPTAITTISFGGTRAGSGLQPVGYQGQATTVSFGSFYNGGTSGSLTGTWRCMGHSQGTSDRFGITLWLRIS